MPVFLSRNSKAQSDPELAWPNVRNGLLQVVDEWLKVEVVHVHVPLIASAALLASKGLSGIVCEFRSNELENLSKRMRPRSISRCTGKMRSNCQACWVVLVRNPRASVHDVLVDCFAQLCWKSEQAEPITCCLAVMCCRGAPPPSTSDRCNCPGLSRQ